ncbi:MAG: nitrous oxide reductase accessory protein NosL [Gallionellaceae bacterium]|nr:nitrous oxide reductase accessory protein NosL [Gallionellaceae bacterium]
MQMPGKYFLRILLPVTLFAAVPACAYADDYAAQQISAQQRCPVCGMYPARYPAWAVQVVFKDHSMTALESPAELFRLLRDVKKYDVKHTVADIARIYATDYAQRIWIDAKQAFYVQNSKVKGPMGGDLPAFASKSAAEDFVKQSGGNILNFDALASLEADSHGAHGHNQQ